jgi:hypothetical protein
MTDPVYGYGQPTTSHPFGAEMQPCPHCDWYRAWLHERARMAMLTAALNEGRIEQLKSILAYPAWPTDLKA